MMSFASCSTFLERIPTIHTSQDHNIAEYRDSLGIFMFSGVLNRIRSAFGPAPEDQRTEKQKAGDAAEDAAAKWLKTEKRFRILERNWRFGRGEIDIIAVDRETMVFVEVRARAVGALVSGYHSVNQKKRDTLRNCALAYLKRTRPYPRHFRFDIVEVELNNGAVGDLRHFEHVPIFHKQDRPTHS
ncbi:MAG: YraN family protein [Verrucomicrobiota bacterium]